MNIIKNYIIPTYFGVIFGMSFGIIRYLYVREKKKYESFKEDIIDALSLGNLNNCEEIDYIYINSTNNNLKDRALSHYLKRVVADLITSSELSDVLSEKEINLIKTYIKKLELRSPFDKLPETEKIICNDIITFIDTDETIKAKEKIHSLSDAIYIREENFQKIKKMNAYSIPIAVIGLVLTIVFGMMSIT